DECVPVARQTVLIHSSAVFEKDVHNILLHAGQAWRLAGGHQSERGTSSPINVGGGINFGFGSEQEFGDVRGVLWTDLAVAFHSVRRNIVQQRPTMLTRGPGPYQIVTSPKQPLQFCDVTSNNGCGSRLESRNRGVRLHKRFNMLSKSGPAQKTVRL